MCIRMFRKSSPAVLRGLCAHTSAARGRIQTLFEPIALHISARGAIPKNTFRNLHALGIALESSGGGTLKTFAVGNELHDPMATLKEEQKVKIMLNGQPIEVRKGSTIIEACKKAKIYVPTLCYHPMLTIVGQCRLCLVQLRNKGNKLVTACSTVVEEGMDVVTDNHEIQSSGWFALPPPLFPSSLTLFIVCSFK